MSRKPVQTVTVTAKRRRLVVLTRKPKNPNGSLFWNCPVCGANFTFKKTKNRHIQVHGNEVVARALVEKTQPEKPQRTTPPTAQFKTKNIRNEFVVIGAHEMPQKRISVKNACRVCGVTPAMPGDDVCYSCHSK